MGREINSVTPSREALEVMQRIKIARVKDPGDHEPTYAEIIDEWRASAKEHERCPTNQYQSAIAEPPRRVLNDEAAGWTLQLLQSVAGAKSEHVEAIKELVEVARLNRVPREASAQYPSREVDPLSQKTEAVGRDPLHPKKGRKGLESGERRAG